MRDEDGCTWAPVMLVWRFADWGRGGNGTGGGERDQ